MNARSLRCRNTVFFILIGSFIGTFFMTLHGFVFQRDQPSPHRGPGERPLTGLPYRADGRMIPGDRGTPVYGHASGELEIQSLRDSVNWTKEYIFDVENFSYPSDNINAITVGMLMKGLTIPNLHPINNYEYEINSNSVHICANDIKVLFVVKSSILHQLKRNIIRTTWGSVSQINGNFLQFVFVVGNPKDLPKKDKELKSLEQEMAIYNDVIHLKFVDAYYNNTLKTLGAMKFVVERCQKKPQFVFFLDDDFYLNPYVLMQFIDAIPSQSLSRLYLGMVHVTAPGRDKSDKWYISKKDYPYPMYPALLRAGAMLMTYDTIAAMHTASAFVKRFIFDDVYLGFIAHKLQIKPRHCDLMSVKKVLFDDPKFCRIIAAHGYTEMDLFDMWFKLMTQCFNANF